MTARGWPLIFGFASLLFGAILVIELAWPEGAGPGGAPRSGASEQSADGDAAPSGPPKLADLSAIVERPVFAPSRRPAPGSRHRPATDAFEVSGTLIGAGRRTALIRLPGSQTLREVEEGQEVAGWKLEKILPDRVIVSSKGETAEIPIWSDAQPAEERNNGR
jgi:hypothetical protein